MREFPSPGQHDPVGLAAGQQDFASSQQDFAPDSSSGPGSKLCARIPPRSRVHGIQSRNSVRAEPGLAGWTLPARRRPLVYEYYAKVVRKEEMFRKMYEDYK